jgi:3-hydroxy-9,10-secoandrosta-1,3,5(10)-triene-9,17-dione monooxygenase reductase component
MTIDPMKYRQVLGHFPTGVTVVTSMDGDEPVGFTVGSFTSVSLEPPLVGFLAMEESDRWRQIRASGRFCVNVLADSHGDLCWQFAKTSITAPFEGVAWHPSSTTGAPVLDEAIAWIDCDLHAVVDAGDHHFVMGRVQDLHHAAADDDPRPLIFYRGTLGGFAAH